MKNRSWKLRWHLTTHFCERSYFQLQGTIPIYGFLIFFPFALNHTFTEEKRGNIGIKLVIMKTSLDIFRSLTNFQPRTQIRQVSFYRWILLCLQCNPLISMGHKCFFVSTDVHDWKSYCFLQPQRVKEFLLCLVRRWKGRWGLFYNKSEWIYWFMCVKMFYLLASWFTLYHYLTGYSVTLERSALYLHLLMHDLLIKIIIVRML